MRELKTWGGTIRNCEYGNRHNQSRIVVRAYTVKQAVEMADIRYNEFRNYFSETHNDREMALPFEVGLWVYDERNQSSYGNDCTIVRLK
jgi:hypothetical protein